MSKAKVLIRRDVLKAWLQLAGVNRTWLAKQLNITKGRVSQLLNADDSPSSPLIASLLLVTNLPFDRLFVVVNGAAHEAEALSNSAAMDALR